MKKTVIWFFIIASILFFVGCGKSDGTVQEITPNQIYTDVDKSVVLLLIIKKNETTSGTAFFIDENGTCVTNYHVIKDGEKGIIQLYDGTTANVEKVVGYDEKADIAILSTSAENTIPVTISKTTPQTGDLVYSIGYKSVSESGVYDSTFNEGIVQKTRIINGNSYIQSTVNIVKGNSGGVLINKYGEIIGITSANESFEKYTGINLSIPIKEIDNVSRDIYEPLDIVTKRHYPVKITFLKQGRIYQKQETEYENKAKEPKEPNETGYVFLGWFSNSSFTEKYDFNKPVLENIYLYAKMEPIQYELVYDLVSGKWQQNIPSDTYTIENSGEKLPIPVRQGSLFEGWKDSEGNFYDVFPEPYDLKNMHLIASWIDGSEGLVLKSIGSEISIAGFAGNEKEVTVPQLYRNKPVTKIEARAFANSSQLERINLSKNVKYICTNAFDNCESLKELIVEEGNENFIGKDGILYLKENCEIFFVPNKLTGDITILEGTNEIKENAFYNRINLTSITILGGEKNIKENAFVGCVNLSRIIGLAMNVSTVSRQAKPNDFEVIITSGENIRERAFSECGGLTSITIAASITSIGNHAFEKCIGLKSIHYMGDISKWCEIEGLRNLTLSTRELFIANNKIEGNLVLPDGTAYISSGAFCGCTGLTSITIPDSVINIGRSAFSGCTSLKNVKIGDGVINIDDSAFV